MELLIQVVEVNVGAYLNDEPVLSAASVSMTLASYRGFCVIFDDPRVVRQRETRRATARLAPEDLGLVAAAVCVCSVVYFSIEMLSVSVVCDVFSHDFQLTRIADVILPSRSRAHTEVEPLHTLHFIEEGPFPDHPEVCARHHLLESKERIR